MLFNLKKKSAPKKTPNPSGRGTSRPRACEYTDGHWLCTLANGKQLRVSGLALVKHLRKALAKSGIRSAQIDYPTSGKGECSLHITYANGRQETVRGACSPEQRMRALPAPRSNPGSQTDPVKVWPFEPNHPSRPERRVAGLVMRDASGGQHAGLPNCCFDPDLMLIVCPDGTSEYDGREVAEVISVNDDGSAVVRLRPLPGDSAASVQTYLVALCTDEVPPPGPPGSGCCYDPASNTLVCEDASDPLHGAAVTVEAVHQNGLATVYVDGDPTKGLRVPICQPQPTPGPNGSGCCFDPQTMTLVCDDTSNPLHGAPVTVEVINEGAGPNGGPLATVYVNGDPSQGMRVPLCRTPAPTPTPTPVPSACCYDPFTNTLLCADAANPLNGAQVTVEVINEGAGPNGTALATVYINGDPSQGMRVPLCETPECCLDLATATLICEDSTSPYAGLAVLVEQATETHARVVHPSLQPLGFAVVPLCQTPPSETGECCFDQDTMTIVCPDPSNPLHGTTAGIVAEFSYPDGAPGVSVAWEGGGARMPLCGRRPPQECPPAYCCVNLDSLTFVCPGVVELNGQPADIVDMIEQGGYSYAVLSDKTLVPVCGRECPPPELCPDGHWRTPTGDCVLPPECPDCSTDECPQCPPGQLLDTRTGICVTPPACPECPPSGSGTIPRCPPGYLLDTATGQCVRCPSGRTPPVFPCDSTPTCPPSEPWWKSDGHCCESCALGKECAGDCGDDCNCGKNDHGHSHDHGTPQSQSNPSHRQARATNRPPWLGVASWLNAGR